MRFLRQMPVMRALLVAFVVLFVFGVGGTSEVFGRTYMQNGHEGDPDDGWDIVGGGGDSSDTFEGVQNRDKNPYMPVIVNLDVEWVFLSDGTVFPIFHFSVFGDDNYGCSRQNYHLVSVWEEK